MSVGMNLFGGVSNTQKFDHIKINIASPNEIRSWSFGEVSKPETINYRTFKPEKEGLFCARIFGPTKDYECLCGKYKRMKYKGVTCEKCGVEVTTARVRRERMGHIDLAAPVAHIWFLKSLPSRISMLLDITMKDLEKVLYFEQYVVVDPGSTPFSVGTLLSEQDFLDAEDKYGEDNFTALIGAEAVEAMLKDLDLQEIYHEIEEELQSTNSIAKKKKLSKRLKLVDDFMHSGNKPEWMILKVLPVIPPDLRPLVMLDGGRFATSDLNELYRRVINRNNRLKRLIELKAPDIIIRNEKRMLQESVDALFDNGRRGKLVKNASKKPFKSLSDMIKGKQGRFRQNLLGKRVDYSGRSVIVVGPKMKLHQCGLPKKMALELFKPFVYSKLELYGHASTVKAAKKIVEAEKDEVWDVLEEVIREHPVLLNRAPTLHRLGIQAFEPILVEGKAIQLHPLVCSAFNADFDGDTMSVHVPLSVEAQLEARVLMMSTNNILSPANGKPIISADQDVVLGVYYLTIDPNKVKKAINEKPIVFASSQEVEYAIEQKIISIHDRINLRVSYLDINDIEKTKIIDTTAGRAILWQIIPQNKNLSFDIINKSMNKKDIASVIDLVYRHCGQKATVIFSDQLMQLGFKYSSQSGISIGMDDMVIPDTKQKHVDETNEFINEFETQYSDGLITQGEKFNKVIDSWSRCTDKIASDMMDQIASSRYEGWGYDMSCDLNSIHMMAVSGARGSAAQIKQLAGMRGLMTKPSGDIIETPIISNFKEGLTVREYFNSTHGARKGLADTALKTANSGYLTRRLVDVGQDCVITEYDCGTTRGVEIKTIIDGGEIIVSLSEQILGRVTSVDIIHPVNGNLILSRNNLIDEQAVKEIEAAGIDIIKVRSVLTCESSNGACAKCYGRDLSTGQMVSKGEAVGIVAAQSIGEPGTQLTLRTFHIGGTATKGAEDSSLEAAFDARVKIFNRNFVMNSDGIQIVISRSCEVILIDNNGNEKSRSKIPYGARVLVDDGNMVTKGQKISEWDPYNIPIITEKNGKVSFLDMISGMSVKDVTDEETGIVNKVVTDYKQYAKGKDLRPRIQLLDDNNQYVELSTGLAVKHYLPVDAIVSVVEGQEVSAGDIIARVPRESSKTKDITGGLPRVAEIFEARKPKEQSLIAEFDGTVEFGKDYKTKSRIILHPVGNNDDENKRKPIEYIIPKGKHIMVGDGDMVKKGDMIVDGNPVLQDILKVMGVEALARYMVQEIQAVYRLQGVKIDDKHIEVIIKQMLQKREIDDAGDTHFITGDIVDVTELEEVNKKFMAKGKIPASANIVLRGITRAALQTRSFISSASFQETTRILTESAVSGKEDNLYGLKENIIVGRLIPAGTGYYINNLMKNS
ncbi:MAG TPA: DNA-directed RNA polymerase subunit beta' [Candidatus Megaira endosymbiont of Hartmannula sinica]|nr:DNA-directed RNA polymerase subunit beta' [Candidatus Megaera endosymbiont of Hartmannula sinica]